MKKEKIALIGNPNVGKSSLFNHLTGLKQKIGNYPGTTVEKRIGTFSHKDSKFTIYDFPGTYSLYPKAKDEEIVFDILSNESHPDFPDKIVVIGTPTQLKRNLMLFQQVKDLGLPVVFVLNMIDEAETNGIFIDKNHLEQLTESKVVFTNARTAEGLQELKDLLESDLIRFSSQFEIPREYENVVGEIQSKLNLTNDYKAWQILSHNNEITGIDSDFLNDLRKKNNIIPGRLQVKETLKRSEVLEKNLEKILHRNPNENKSFTDKLDAILTHPVLGYFIFFGILFFAFQAIYSWSEWPMNLIDSTFAGLQNQVKSWLGEGPLVDLITDGIIPGIGGIVIFIPQIVILFFFLILMEETGYMSRVVFLMDKWLKPFGLNGKSVVPLMSGAACAIPAVMSARNIENTKERLITILVTPFMTCSARLPVYAILIALVIPKKNFLGFELQGWVLMALYLLGIVAALVFAYIFKFFIKSKYRSYLIMEMPNYRLPVWRNVLLGLWEKTSAFVFGAGKIILAISIILWALSAWGFNDNFKNSDKIIAEKAVENNWNEEETEDALVAHKLENSLLGNIGHAVEPIFRPLGYDWKISIGVLSSFAAREVFVGTMASIYSIGSQAEDESRIMQRMKNEKYSNGNLVYNLATGVSLMLFYALAMQCMSTLAIVKKETATWKWPLIQLGIMTAIAYLAALIAYQILK